MEKPLSEKSLAYRLSQLYYLPKQGDPFKHKTQCPACMASNPHWREKCFTPFVHVSTGEVLDPNVGYCDYASCPLNPNNSPLKPYDFFLNSHVDAERFRHMVDDCVCPPRPLPKLVPLRIPWEDVKPSLSLNPSCVDFNTLFLGLVGMFCRKYSDLLPSLVWRTIVNEMYGTYMVGTFHNSGQYRNLNGSAIFWEIDEKLDVREGKIMQFNPETAHRVKDNGSINWVGNIGLDGKKNYVRDNTQREHCLFGLHILATSCDKVDKVYVVESQKTAIAMRIDSILAERRRCRDTQSFEPPIFLATGGCAMLRKDLLAPLSGFCVEVIPDSGKATEHWREAVAGMPNVVVNDCMERLRMSGACGENADLLDVLF